MPRLGDRLEDRVIEEVTRVCIANEETSVFLTSLVAAVGTDFEALGNAMQSKGYGTLITHHDGGSADYRFKPSEIGYRHGHEVRQSLEARSFWGRIKSVNRSDWIALGAFAVSVIALIKD